MLRSTAWAGAKPEVFKEISEQRQDLDGIQDQLEGLSLVIESDNPSVKEIAQKSKAEVLKKRQELLARMDRLGEGFSLSEAFSNGPEALFDCED